MDEVQKGYETLQEAALLRLLLVRAVCFHKKSGLLFGETTKKIEEHFSEAIDIARSSGMIVGLIGENGASKSTTINAILDLIQKDEGTVSIFGAETNDNAINEKIGIVFDGSNYPETLTLRQSEVISYRKQDYKWQVLIADRNASQKKYPKAMIIPVTIGEIMLLHVKGYK